MMRVNGCRLGWGLCAIVLWALCLLPERLQAVEDTVTVLTPGAPVAGEITQPDEIDYYQIDADGENPLYISLLKDAPWAARLEVRQGTVDGQVVLQVDEHADPSAIANDQWFAMPAPAAGTYYICVELFDAVEPVTTPQRYTVTASRQLPALTSAPTTAAFAGQHSIRWYALPAVVGKPLFAFANHDSAHSLSMDLVRGSLSGDVVTSANGAGDQLLYLPQADSDVYLLRVTNCTAPHCVLTAGSQFPLITGDAPVNDVIANRSDIHWYEVPVAANEQVVLHLDKQTAFATDTPMVCASPLNPSLTGTTSGDHIQVLHPTTATTYLVRIAGDSGQYTLKAMRTFSALPGGQFADAAMAHPGDERWFEVTVPANKPFLLAHTKAQGGESVIDVYRQSLLTPVVTVNGATSEYRYLPAQAQATRYVIRKRASETNFIVDSAERICAGASLPELAVGKAEHGDIASQYQRCFYQLAISNRPLVFQCSLPITLDEPALGKSTQITTSMAVGGMGAPTVVVVSSPTPCSFALTASTDLTGVNTLRYSNAALEATVDLTNTTVGRVKYYAGSNTYLGGEGAGAQYLHVFEGQEYATGWLLTGATADTGSLQLTWNHAASHLTKKLVARATAQRAEISCQIDTPKPVTVRNALMTPSPAGSTHSYAVPMGMMTTNTYTLGGATAVYPTVLGGMVSPAERWVAFWNSAVDEVYGVTLGSGQRVALSTDGAYTVTRVLCSAGRTAFTVTLARPKGDPVYRPVQNAATQPVLTIAHAADAPRVPVGSAITGTMLVRNIAPGAANSITVTCQLPPHAAYIDGSADSNGAYAADTRTITWSVSAMAPGSERALTYRYRLDAALPLGTAVEIMGAVRSAEQAEPSVAYSRTVTSGPSLSGVTPANPGNTGPVTLTLTGECLSEASVVAFAQAGQTITATATALRPDRTELQALIDVTGLSGVWDIAVTNPGGAAALLSSAVTVTDGGQSTFWCDLTAPRSLALGTRVTLLAQYGNTGTVDVVDRLLALYIPADKFTVGAVRDEYGTLLAGPELPASLSGPLLFLLPRIGPGETRMLSIEIEPVSATGTNGLYPNTTLLAGSLTREQLHALLGQATADVLAISTADKPALNALVPAAVNNGLASWEHTAVQPIWSPVVELMRRVREHATLQQYLKQSDSAATGLVLAKILTTLKAGGDYAPVVVKCEYAPTISSSSGALFLKTGPLGVRGTGYTTAEQAFHYRIACANPPEATTAVKEVIITDVLDASLDWSTLCLGTITIGGTTLDLTGSALPYHGYMDLRPVSESMAEITITFDQGQGILLWRVMGYHPLTGAKYDLLLPNTAQQAPRGEMQVAFSVQPRASLTSGTTIKNKASITFDSGTANATNETMNRIDTTPPASSVTPLPQVQEDAVFTVEWGGQDDVNGSGLASYSIFVSDDDAPYTCWLRNVTATSASFTGKYGHTYAFYSIAEDAIGFVELAPDVPDAVIKIGREISMAKGLRLVSIPVIPQTADPKTVMGFDGNKWARHVPGSGYVTYGNDPGHATWFEPAASVPGRAYWGFWAEDRIVDVDGTVPMTTSPYAITLTTGWNLIGNPWTKRVTWDPTTIKVQADGQTKTLTEAAQLGWVLDYAWGWAPGTSNPATGQYWMIADTSITAALHYLDPWRGCWVKAMRDCTLLVPPPSALPASSATTRRRLVADGWQIRLSAHAASGEDGFNWIGMGSRADVLRAGRIESPPSALTPAVELALGGQNEARAVDLREIGSTNPTWTFRVTSPQPGETVTLNWPDLTAAPAHLGLVLVNERTNERRNMRTTSEYQFTMPEGEAVSAPFRIETSQTLPLQILQMTAMPAATRGGGVQLRYTLSQGATTYAEVRTITGKLVCRLAESRVEGNTPAMLQWNGRFIGAGAVPPGLYLIMLTAKTDDGTCVRAATSCMTR